MSDHSANEQEASSSHQAGAGEVKAEEGLGEECAADLPKNRQWSEEEHILYLLFLEMNRERIKSKLIRRSNSFYKDMSQFVGSKTAVQCRSHNQKYEEKYRYPHRIIREEKEKVCPQLYARLQVAAKQQAVKLQEADRQRSHSEYLASKPPPKEKQCFGCQTDIKGVEVVFLMGGSPPAVQVEQPGPQWYYSQWMPQQWQYPQMQWFY